MSVTAKVNLRSGVVMAGLRHTSLTKMRYENEYLFVNRAEADEEEESGDEEGIDPQSLAKEFSKAWPLRTYDIAWIRVCQEAQRLSAATIYQYLPQHMQGESTQWEEDICKYIGNYDGEIGEFDKMEIVGVTVSPAVQMCLENPYPELEIAFPSEYYKPQIVLKDGFLSFVRPKSYERLSRRQMLTHFRIQNEEETNNRFTRFGSSSWFNH